MANKPLVSVIMGIYNCSDTLEKAVKCIQEQSYDTWELIMCDDCSTDRTYEIAEMIAKADARISLIRNNTNLTLAPTLNKCLNLAKGKYIARMDGDDTCLPERFEKEIAFLENHLEFDILSCSMSLSNENGVFRVIRPIEEPTIKDFIYSNQHCHAPCMVRTEAIRAVGGYSESKKYHRVEDYDLWVRMYKAGYRGYNLQEVLYDMFDSEDAAKRRSLSNRINESRVIYNACKAVGGFYYPRMFVPIIKWLFPSSLYKRFHKSKR